MQVFGYHDDAHIVLNAAAVTANMQTDAAAFEAWALVLHTLAGAKSVRLSWDCPESRESGDMGHHEERLAYRAHRFQELFEWFTVDTDTSISRALNKSGGPAPVLNTAGDRSAFRERSRSRCSALGAWTSEHEMECSLRYDPLVGEHFGLSGKARRDQQFPVGLFEADGDDTTPRHGRRIFPGGKGAIDLMAMDGQHLSLFELKAKENSSVGALSELFFYTSVMRDARRGLFQFANGTWAGCDIAASDIMKAERLSAVLLADKVHRLLARPEVWRVLNAAVAERWTDGPRVDFRATQITASGFTDVST